MTRITAIDLCAGAGGLSKGLRAAGLDTLGVELDSDAAESHRYHVGPCVQADIATWHPSERAHVVAGGVPCQPWSTAGQRGGLEDERGRLYQHVVRVAIEAGAEAVVLENVSGLTTAIEHIEAALAGGGYDCRWRVLDAADYGVPQHRRRAFIVGLRSPAARAAWAWPEPTHGPCMRRPWQTVREALGLVGDYEVRRYKRGSVGLGQRWIDVDAPAPTVRASDAPDLLMPRGGTSRRLTLWECAVLQGVTWPCVGTRRSQVRQVGNAVPPRLAEAIGRSVARAVAAAEVTR